MAGLHVQEIPEDQRLEALIKETQTNFRALGMNLVFLSEVIEDHPTLFEKRYRERFPMPESSSPKQEPDPKDPFHLRKERPGNNVKVLAPRRTMFTTGSASGLAPRRSIPQPVTNIR